MDRHILSEWDGKTTAFLERQMAQFRGNEAALWPLCADGDDVTARAATWIALALVREGAISTLPDGLLRPGQHWEVSLHILQCAQHLPPMNPGVIAPFLDHSKTLVRVWALDAYARTGAADRCTRIGAALSDGAASEKARARKLQALFCAS